MQNDATSFLKALNLGADDLLSEHELAAKLNKTKDTLRNWRTKNIGPRFVKIGNSVRYRGQDVAEYLAGRMIDPASRRGAAA